MFFTLLSLCTKNAPNSSIKMRLRSLMLRKRTEEFFFFAVFHHRRQNAFILHFNFFNKSDRRTKSEKSAI